MKWNWIETIIYQYRSYIELFDSNFSTWALASVPLSLLAGLPNPFVILSPYQESNQHAAFSFFICRSDSTWSLKFSFPLSFPILASANLERTEVHTPIWYCRRRHHSHYLRHCHWHLWKISCGSCRLLLRICLCLFCVRHTARRDKSLKKHLLPKSKYNSQNLHINCFSGDWFSFEPVPPCYTVLSLSSPWEYNLSCSPLHRLHILMK